MLKGLETLAVHASSCVAVETLADLLLSASGPHSMDVAVSGLQGMGGFCTYRRLCKRTDVPSSRQCRPVEGCNRPSL